MYYLNSCKNTFVKRKKFIKIVMMELHTVRTDKRRVSSVLVEKINLFVMMELHTVRTDKHRVSNVSLKQFC